jgi:hypothetical protein
MSLSGFGLLAAFVVMAVSLAVQWGTVARLPVPGEFAVHRGRAGAGVRYAFTTAFLPWAKESGRRHPLGYGAGVVLHTAVLLALFLALWSVGRPLPAPGWAGGAVVVILGFGCVAGLGLLARRLVSRRLRELSIGDDYLSIGAVTAVVGMALAAATGVASPATLRVATAVLLLYVPLGKLRHMVFLVPSRVFWGRNLGRRGVLPPPRPGGEKS